ncbi:TolC family protein [Flavobacterium sp. PL002]|uniref:TolC family protein n=1 Tax=Flavobacterium sp. PL002 TaxID=1897058 RepID=UPI0017879987|nr:TolC family protein [Flavobacterium sp. PL002]MBE0392130.1 Outer membrane protein OprM [Flavobacterium sp. PL002]
MNRSIFKFIKTRSVLILALPFMVLQSCVPKREIRNKKTGLPEYFNDVVSNDSINSANMKWKEFFNDTNLNALIDTALVNNQELNIMLQQVDMAKNEIQARKGEYLPSVGIAAAAEVEKVGRYTSQGASDANTKVKGDQEFPEALPNYSIGAFATWEVDVWKKLRNSKKAAAMEYLSSVEGKNFMVTNLIAEIADSYYELQELDNKLLIIKQNLELQNNGLKTIRLQKIAAKATELGVQRLEAEVYKNTGELYAVKQEVVEVENKLNFLIGRTPQHIIRESMHFIDKQIDTLYVGVPSQLLINRPDIRKAEYELSAAKLDTKVAKANFYPSLTLRAGVGVEAFKLKYITTTPESLLYTIAGDVVAPLINRNAIKAAYYNANDMQLQAIFDYEKTVLNAHVEVLNGMSKIENLKQIYGQKEKQVTALTNSIKITNTLFKAARADYMEVLLTQRDALEAKLDLVEAKKQQLMARVNMYKSLGGGWN